MAVPEEIRMVGRPVNTIVEDRGKDGPFCYAVRERNGVRYVKGGNPMPRNGHVIGHIIDGRFLCQVLNAGLRQDDDERRSDGLSV